MKKLTQKLVLSVVTMALVVIALGTSTFAWFTLTNSASISVFDAQVTAGEGIEVTLGKFDALGQPYLEPDANTIWYTVLPTSVIEQYITDRYTTNFRFTDLTSEDGVTFDKYNLDTNVLAEGVSEGFLEIPLYFRSAVRQDIVWKGAVFGGTSKVWSVNVATFDHTDGVAYGTDEAGFTTLRVAAWTAARTSVTGLVGTATPVSSTTIFQESTTPKDSVSNSNATLASYDFSAASPFVAGGGALDPVGAASYALATGKTISLNALPTVPNAVTSVNNSVVTLKTNAFAGFATYYTGIATVRIWIEGWDADTYDAIFNTQLTIQLNFGTATATV